MNERLTGLSLGVVTALLNRRGQGADDLAGVTGGQGSEVVEVLARLRDCGIIEVVGRGEFGLTVDGLRVFYRTIGEIRDTLAPSRPVGSLPFTMETVWRECLCFNYTVSPAALRPLIPSVFDLVTRSGRAILSVTAASLSSMRPRGLPELVGQNFCHVTYRALVKFVNGAGVERTGYDFTASITNHQLLSRIGNSLTEFKFHEFRTGRITFLRQGSRLVLAVEGDSPDLNVVVTVDHDRRSNQPPEGSVFSSREELERLVIDHTDAFGYLPEQPYAYVLSIDRDPWHYDFVSPSQVYMAYFQEGQPFDNRTARLDCVLHCRNVGYRWKPLQREVLGAFPLQ